MNKIVICKLSGASIGEAHDWKGITKLVVSYISGKIPNPQVLNLGSYENGVLLLARDKGEPTRFPVYHFMMYDKGVNNGLQN